VCLLSICFRLSSPHIKHKKKFKMTPIVRVLVAITSLIVIVACSGGSDDGSPENISRPTISLSSSVEAVTTNTEFTLTWSTTNASSCTASGDWSGTKTTSGSESISESSVGTKTYSLTCSGAAGDHTLSIEVEVSDGRAAIWDQVQVVYGTEDADRQWLNIHNAYDQTKPSPVYLYAHANGGSAYGMSEKQLHAIAEEGYTAVSWASMSPLLMTVSQIA